MLSARKREQRDLIFYNTETEFPPLLSFVALFYVQGSQHGAISTNTAEQDRHRKVVAPETGASRGTLAGFGNVGWHGGPAALFLVHFVECLDREDNILFCESIDPWRKSDSVK